MPTRYEEIVEGLAKRLFLWLHYTCAKPWEHKDTSETVRVAHRKRAEELLKYLEKENVLTIKEGN